MRDIELVSSPIPEDWKLVVDEQSPVLDRGLAVRAVR